MGEATGAVRDGGRPADQEAGGVSSEGWNTFLAEAGALLASSLDFETTLQRVAQLAVPRVADWCVVHVVEEPGQHPRRLATAHSRADKDALCHELAERYPLDAEYPFTVLRVLESGTGVYVPEIDMEAVHAAARDEGERYLLDAIGPKSEIAVAMVVRGRILGALNLLITEPGRRYGDGDLAQAGELAHLAGLALDNARLYRAAQREVTERARAEAAQRFLVEASTALASSLDYEETLKRIARLTVPLLGDICSVDVVEDDGHIHRIAAAHRDPTLEGVVARLLERFPVVIHAEFPSAHVVRTGKRWYARVIPDAMLEEVSGGDAALLAALRALEPRALLCVPLVARERTLGAIVLCRTDPGHAYAPGEVELAEELARRAALAVDNARLYGDAIAASQAKSDFLAVMSHELRTPLTTVIGYAELLADGVSGPVSPTQRRQLSRIQASAQHLLQLIEQILSFSRIEAGRERVRIEALDAVGLAQESALLIEPAARGRSLKLVLDLPFAPVPVETDGGKVRQILVNLLANGIKFTDHGEVGIKLRAVPPGEPEGIVYEVWDTGIGISADHLDHIFDPFWQVEQQASRRVGGTGLGLSVVRHLARLLGGEVDVESEVGIGTRFTVRLPVRTVEMK
ncbi:MAG: ATP-binding protein [Gemmatimonadaceae bacterium]